MYADTNIFISMHNYLTAGSCDIQKLACTILWSATSAFIERLHINIYKVVFAYVWSSAPICISSYPKKGVIDLLHFSLFSDWKVSPYGQSFSVPLRRRKKYHISPSWHTKISKKEQDICSRKCLPILSSQHTFKAQNFNSSLYSKKTPNVSLSW